MKFGDNLKIIRKNNKMSQEELAQRVNVSRQAVSKWENGESYPEMNNILELCKIFNCQINDLVHTDMSDLTLLDKEIVMTAAKFNESKQNHVKSLSNIISLIGKIGSIVLKVAIPFVVIAMFLVPYLINNLEIINNKIISKTDQIEIIADNKIEVYNFMLIELDHDMTFQDLVSILNNHSKTKIIIYLEIGLLFLIIDLIIMIIILEYVYKLFTNIKEKTTPFILENVKYLKRITYLIITLIMISPITNMLFSHILDISSNSDGIELVSILEILIIFSMSYIFEYGYEIQKDSQGKMYN